MITKTCRQSALKTLHGSSSAGGVLIEFQMLDFFSEHFMDFFVMLAHKLRLNFFFFIFFIFAVYKVKNELSVSTGRDV